MSDPHQPPSAEFGRPSTPTTASDVAREATLAADASRRRRATLAFGAAGTIGLAACALLGLRVEETDLHEEHLPAAWPLGVLPFVTVLLLIAVFPLIKPLAGWWHHNRNKLAVSVVAAFATLGYLLVAIGSDEVFLTARHALIADFVPFISLLFALFVVTGGIRLEGDLPARPIVTTSFLAVGAVIASVVGTTGASMLLIRPLLATTADRTRKVHTFVFFIFLVANIGGTLLPIGDPPLFMGYLRGVPFEWTLGLWKEWAFCVAALLVVHLVIDFWAWRHEPTHVLIAEPVRRTPLGLRGTINFLYLAIIVAGVATIDPSRAFPGTTWHPFAGLREIVLLGAAGLSLLTTPRGLREANHFTFEAIGEVAAVFLGIFVTMMVPLMVLRQAGPELGLDSPGHFFWATGILSSVLDNAPTYVVFLEAGTSLPVPAGTSAIPLDHGVSIAAPILTAISLGAVFMGANTYIGNGPNFMVRSIAEESGIKMPSFFGYLLWSIGFLVPLFIAVHWLFL